MGSNRQTELRSTTWVTRDAYVETKIVPTPAKKPSNPQQGAKKKLSLFSLCLQVVNTPTYHQATPKRTGLKLFRNVGLYNLASDSCRMCNMYIYTAGERKLGAFFACMHQVSTKNKKTSSVGKGFSQPPPTAGRPKSRTPAPPTCPVFHTTCQLCQPCPPIPIYCCCLRSQTHPVNPSSAMRVLRREQLEAPSGS